MALVDNVWYVDSVGYSAVTAWSIGASKVCGNLVRQSATPTVGNERVFVCVASTSGTGTTGGSEPSWTVTRGAKTTDNTVTWQEATGIAALNGDLTDTPNWNTVKNTAVTLGQVITNVAGTLILIATTAGTAGNGAEPSWSAFTNAGATTADNTVTWTTLGASFSNWAAPQARLANALAATWGQAGNKFFVASEHAETQSTAITLSSSGTSAAPCYAVCVDKTNVPPGSSDVTTGATVTSTLSGTSITIGSAAAEYVDYYGIGFSAGTGSGSPSIQFGAAAAGWLRFENCAFTLVGTGVANTGYNFHSRSGSDDREEFINCSFVFAATGQGCTVGISSGGGPTIFRGGSLAASGSIPTTVFTSWTPFLLFDSVDLSAINSTLFSSSATSPVGFAQLRDCKLNASVTLTGGASIAVIDVVRSDSAGHTYRNERHTTLGDETTETTVTRSGGASDGATSFSRKIVTTSKAAWAFPFEALPLQIWNAKVGSPVTVTVYGVWGPGAVPNNDQVWMDVKYPGSSGSPLATIATTTKANVLTGSTPDSTDTSTWGGSTTPFKMTKTFTPQLAGMIEIYVKAGIASSTIYIDPKPVLS